MPNRTKGKLSASQIVELYKTKGSKEIAELDGTSPLAVRNVLRKSGVQIRRQGHNEVYRTWKKHGLAGFAVQHKTAPVCVYRLAAILRLGGQCVLCGTRDFRVLEINHVNGFGETDYLKVACGAVSDLEVRCANCNVVHEFERGNKRLLSVLVNSATGRLTRIGKKLQS